MEDDKTKLIFRVEKPINERKMLLTTAELALIEMDELRKSVTACPIFNNR